MPEGYEIGLWCLLISATATDLIWGKVFNWMNLLFAVVGFAYHFSAGGSSALVSSAIAVLTAFLLFFPLYLLRAMAAGDVKLLMAVGAWSDTKLVVQMGVIAILIGALVGGFVLLRSKGVKGGFTGISAHLRPQDNPTTGMRMPFAPAFLCAYFCLHIFARYQWLGL